MNNYIAIGTPITLTSVNSSSNFVAANFSTYSFNSEKVVVEFASATTAEFQLVVDNGTASVVITTVPEYAASSQTLANELKKYVIILDPRNSYNFRQDTSGTVHLFQAFRVDPS